MTRGAAASPVRRCHSRGPHGILRWLRLGLCAAPVLAALASGSCGTSAGHESVTTSAAPRILLITAHPDDETMFDLGRFRERGWDVSVALVTNGENGQVVQAVRDPYDPASGDDILIEKLPGPGTWLTTPPQGPRLRKIRSPVALAEERRREFIDSLSFYGVTRVFFLSGLQRADFEDSWDSGVSRWDKGLLAGRLEEVVRRARPDLIITLNPAETWAHLQHWGLARIVQALLEEGAFDVSGRPRPALYGIREDGWYKRSQRAQPGDIELDRTAFSPVLGKTYAEYWKEATSAYISQSSHPDWFAARVRAGILPGYGAVDIIRLLEPGEGRPRLDVLLESSPPDSAAMARLPSIPAIMDLSGE